MAINNAINWILNIVIVLMFLFLLFIPFVLSVKVLDPEAGTSILSLQNSIHMIKESKLENSIFESLIQVYSTLLGATIIAIFYVFEKMEDKLATMNNTIKSQIPVLNRRIEITKNVLRDINKMRDLGLKNLDRIPKDGISNMDELSKRGNKELKELNDHLDLMTNLRKGHQKPRAFFLRKFINILISFSIAIFFLICAIQVQSYHTWILILSLMVMTKASLQMYMIWNFISNMHYDTEQIQEVVESNIAYHKRIITIDEEATKDSEQDLVNLEKMFDTISKNKLEK